MLSLLSDGMASPSEARRVESHLAECPECRRALECMQATRLVIARRPAAIPPPDLRMRIAQAIAAEAAAGATARPAPRPLVLRPAFAMAATIALVAAAGVTLDRAPQARHHPVIMPPVKVASDTSPKPAHRPVVKSSVTMPDTHSDLGRQVADATSPATHPVLPRLKTVLPTEKTRIATAPDDTSIRLPRTMVTPMVQHHSTPLVKALPDKPLLAKSVTPHISPLPMKRTPRLEARIPTDMPLHNSTETAVTPSAPPVAPDPTEVERPEPTHVEVVAALPSPPKVVHEDVLSHVRTSLAAFNSDSSYRKVARNEAAHVESAAFTSEPGGFAPFVPTNYTPGLNSKKDKP